MLLSMHIIDQSHCSSSNDAIRTAILMNSLTEIRSSLYEVCIFNSLVLNEKCSYFVAANYIGDYLRRRDKRSANDDDDHMYAANSRESTVQLPDQHRHAFHGGERAILYGVVEDLIATFGMNGKACLLRAICESHSRSMDSLGLIGEIVKLFFT